MAGLIIISICVGYLTKGIFGWLVFGFGVMIKDIVEYFEREDGDE